MSDDRVGGYVDPMWGRLTTDREALAVKLGEATRAVYDAAITAQYRTDAGTPIHSPMSSILGGLSQVIDGLLDLLGVLASTDADAPKNETTTAQKGGR